MQLRGLQESITVLYRAKRGLVSQVLWRNWSKHGQINLVLGEELDTLFSLKMMSVVYQSGNKIRYVYNTLFIESLNVA